MIGYQRPRLSCFPQGVTGSLGQEAIELAATAGLILDDWQQWSITNIMSVRASGTWAAFESAEIVGRQNGKGAILEARELYGLFGIRTDVYIAHTAHEFKTARKHFYRLKFLIDNTPQLSRRVAKISEAHGQEGITLRAGPTLIMGSDGRFVQRNQAKLYEIIARSGGSGRGFSGDLLVYDEGMILDALKVGATLPTLSARPNPQVIYMASAGFKHSTQLAKVRRRGISGNGRSLFFAEWSIDPCDDYCAPDCDKHDVPGTEDSYAKSNPTYNIRIGLEYLENEREGFESEAEWLRERLGVGEYPAPLDGWFVISKKWYENCLDASDAPPRPDRPTFSVDIAPDRTTAAIGMCGIRPDGNLGVQVVDHRSGTEWLVSRCVDLASKYPRAKWVGDKRAIGSVLDELDKKGIRFEVLQAQDVSHACGQTFDAFRDGTVRHLGQKPLRDAIAGCDRRFLAEAWAWDKKNAAVDLTPLVAVTNAIWGWNLLESHADYDIGESLGFNNTEVVRLIQAGAYDLSDLERLHQSGVLSATDLESIRQELASART